MTKTVAVIGGGPAGIEASKTLAREGCRVILIEEDSRLGGHLNQWDRLFPSKRESREVLDFLQQNLQAIDRVTAACITDISSLPQGYRIQLSNNEIYTVDSIILATGFQVFDARLKEEYGYGIYDNVITSVELEMMFREETLQSRFQSKPSPRIGMIHCVGSRDEKVGNMHCSRVCCVTAVKQAIEMKEMMAGARVFCFYMDMRMFGLGYEELYKESQEKWGVQYIRGRLSESFENQDSTIMVKVEDTLSGKPLRMNLDLLVLMVGMLPSGGSRRLGQLLGLDFNPNGFLKPLDEHIRPHDTGRAGIFLAGSCKGPKNVEESLADARSAAVRVMEYFSNSLQ